MSIKETKLPGVLLFEPRVFDDERGFFLETFRQESFENLGLDVDFVQHNHSRSRRGVLRGLHYQLEQPQGKLVRVARGSIFDVAVDIRKGSPTFGQWFGAELSDENHHQLYVPPDFAHGFLVLSDVADVIYKCTDYYHPQSEEGISWDDPGVAISWPLEKLAGAEILVSEKDQHNPQLADQTLLPSY